MWICENFSNTLIDLAYARLTGSELLEVDVGNQLPDELPESCKNVCEILSRPAGVLKRQRSDGPGKLTRKFVRTVSDLRAPIQRAFTRQKLTQGDSVHITPTASNIYTELKSPSQQQEDDDDAFQLILDKEKNE
jgi:hypothetical protein